MGSVQNLPVIDLAATATDEGVVGAGAELDAACRRLGLFEVVGHGVPPALFTELFAVTRQFFALPDSVKSRVAQPAPDQVRGWSAVGSEGVAYSLDEESPADLREKLDIGPPVRASDADTRDGYYFDPARAGPHLAPNLWPREPAGLRAVWETYYAHLDRVCATLMRLCATRWGLPVHWFDSQIDRSVSMLRALYYPAQIEPPLSGQLRTGVHTDYGAFTVLTGEDAPGGLEVLDRVGQWTPVTTTPGRLLVAVGDLLAEWTADEWPATLHRVANPPAGGARNSTRLAFAFYQEPNYDMHVDILPPFRRPDWIAQSPVLTAGEHLRQKYLRQTTFGRRPPQR
ncbi:isopenicillin N synthase family dioxygenase [uncultured Jatrophihabitans sp.]|uniref:isopenicillin N synthase family dioxygenase n=1 Tax=uncultured Jatrophihabitans sp. TaxID=1610747 RepID=UPI0035CB7AD6